MSTTTEPVSVSAVATWLTKSWRTWFCLVGAPLRRQPTPTPKPDPRRFSARLAAWPHLDSLSHQCDSFDSAKRAEAPLRLPDMPESTHRTIDDAAGVPQKWHQNRALLGLARRDLGIESRQTVALRRWADPIIGRGEDLLEPPVVKQVNSDLYAARGHRREHADVGWWHWNPCLLDLDSGGRA